MHGCVGNGRFSPAGLHGNDSSACVTLFGEAEIRLMNRTTRTRCDSTLLDANFFFFLTCSLRGKRGRGEGGGALKKYISLTTHSTHFIYGYMASDIR